MANKTDGDLRPCVDYKAVNAQTAVDNYPLPNIRDFTSQLHGTTVFSKVDLYKGYHQIPVAPEDIPKTAVITPWGLWEFLRLPMGLSNASQSFQRLMDEVTRDLPRTFVYLDDVLVASRSEAEHREDLRRLFERLRDFGLAINPGKCEFGRDRVEFLGFAVTKSGISPTASKISAVTEFPRPSDVKGLQRFLGMLNYYRSLIPKAAAILKPLYTATSTTAKKVDWTPEAISAFDSAKAALAQATAVVHPDPNAELALTTDASSIAVAAVLEQRGRSGWEPLAFFSRHLRPAEIKYSAFDRELLAIHLAVRHFRDILTGMPFTIFTDHKPLVTAFSSTTVPWSARQQRHLLAVSEYSPRVVHVAGKDNVVADALSRPETPDLPEPHGQVDAIHTAITTLDYRALAEDQRSDPDILTYGTAITGLQPSWVELVPGIKVLCDLSTGRNRPILPPPWRRRAFDLKHGLAHPSIRSTRRLVTDAFVWHGVGADVTRWTKACSRCQAAKVGRHTRPATAQLPMPQCRFSHVHVDLVGPLPPSQGHRYLLTVVDRTTRWPEAIPLADVSTDTVAQAFLNGWVARFGIPTMSRQTGERSSLTKSGLVFRRSSDAERTPPLPTIRQQTEW